MSRGVRRAITFGQKYRQDMHPKLGWLAHPDGYIVVEAPSHADAWSFLAIICGIQDGAVQFAFEYDLEEFERPGGSAEKYHPKGCLARFSAYPTWVADEFRLMLSDGARGEK